MCGAGDGEDVTAPLTDMLLSRIAAVGNLTTDELTVYVDDETPFLRKHMKEVLRLLETSGRIRVDSIKLDGNKRKAGTFPEGVRFSYTG